MKMSIILVCGLLVFAGCVSHRVIENTRTPEIELTEFGKILVNGQPVEIQDLLSATQEAGFEKEQEVNVLLPENPDRRLMQRVTGILVHGGFHRTIFVSKKKALSDVPSQSQTTRKVNQSRRRIK